MALSPEAIKNWTGLFQGAQEFGAMRPHLSDLAQAKRDYEVGRAGISTAESQFAPQYFGARADLTQNQSGLTGLEAQYLPMKYQLMAQETGMGNALKQLQIDQIRNQMMNPPPPKYASSFGELLADRNLVSQQYGLESPELKQFDQHIQNELAQKKGGGISGYDPATGDVSEAGVIPTAPTVNKLQSSIADLMKMQNDLANIRTSFSPGYLTYKGRGRATAAEKWDLLNPGSLPKSEAEFLKNRTKFINMGSQLFDLYRHTVSGSQSSDKEYEKLKSSILNPDQSPRQFIASMEIMEKKVKEAIMNEQSILNKGFPQVGAAQNNAPMEGGRPQNKGALPNINDLLAKRGLPTIQVPTAGGN